MFRSVLKGIFVIWMMTTATVAAASAFGAAQNTLVLQIVTGKDNTRFRTEYLHHLLDMNIGLTYVFPIAHSEANRGYSSFGPNLDSIVLRDSLVLNPDEDILARRLTQHIVDVYDVKARKTYPLLRYTQPWISSTASGQAIGPDVFDTINQFTSPDENRELLILHHRTMEKLFVFDVLNAYHHLYTVSLPLNRRNLSGSFTNLSPDSTQIAMRYGPRVLMIINVDGSNQRTFSVPNAEDFLPIWSDNSRYILINPFTVPFSASSIRVLDVETGQWRHDIERMEAGGSSWVCNGKWLMYVTQREQDPRYESHLFNMETGRIIHLDNNPVLAQLGEATSSYTYDCNQIIVSTDSQPGPSRSTMYIGNFDFSDFRKIDDGVISTTFWQYADGEIRYRVLADDDETLTQIFEKSLDDLENPTIIGYAPLEMPYLEYVSFQHQVAIYRDSLGNMPGSGGNLPSPIVNVMLVDLRNGQERMIFETSATIMNISSVYDDGE